MVFAALAIGIGIPLMPFGGSAPMFAAWRHSRPAHLTMPGRHTNLGHAWFISTVLLTRWAFTCGPRVCGHLHRQERRHLAPQAVSCRCNPYTGFISSPLAAVSSSWLSQWAISRC